MIKVWFKNELNNLLNSQLRALSLKLPKTKDNLIKEDYIIHQHNKLNSVLNELIERVKMKSFQLYQETSDTLQLDPIWRLTSISNVLEHTEHLIDNPKYALDVGSGFGYWTVFLSLMGIHTIGIENIDFKIKQWISMFNSIWIKINQVLNLNFDNYPAILNWDLNKLSTDIATTELITMFYLSEELVTNPKTFKTCKKLLNPNWNILLSTEVSKEKVMSFINSGKVNFDGFNYKIIEIPNNTEKTAIILSPK